MFTAKRVRFVLLVASTMLLAAAIGPQSAQTVLALPSPQAGVTIPYAGRLDRASSENVPDGMYDFTFSIFGAQEGGKPLWSEKQLGVPVRAGAFATSLGSVVPLPKDMLTIESRWLAVAVRGPGETSFTPLAPRQRLDALATSSPTESVAGSSYGGRGDALGASFCEAESV
jgi:hypothetical protein